MFLHLTKVQIIELEKLNKAKNISLWDDYESAQKYYSDHKGIYAAYIENKNNLTFAYATSVKVYIIHQVL